MDFIRILLALLLVSPLVFSKEKKKNESTKEETTETHTETTVEETTQKPIEETTEKHVKETTEKHVEETTEKHVEETGQKHVEETAEKHVEGTTEKHVEETAEKHVEETAEKHVEGTTEKHVEGTTEKHVEETNEQRTVPTPTTSTFEQGIFRHFSTVLYPQKSSLYEVTPMSIRKLTRNIIYYPKSEVARFYVPEDLISWNVTFMSYSPPIYTSSSVLRKPWSDPNIMDRSFNPRFNQIDGLVNRISYTATYMVFSRYPLNPMGRTGLKGRGLLGRWGPNHCVHVIITRWKLTPDRTDVVYHEFSRLPILQVLVLKKKGSPTWVTPGKMCLSGESFNETVKRVYKIGLLNLPTESIGSRVDSFFDEKGTEIYKGYSDDARNTDNAWVERIVYHYHDDERSVSTYPLSVADEKFIVSWIDISKHVRWLRTDRDYLHAVASYMNCHWGS